MMPAIRQQQKICLTDLLQGVARIDESNELYINAVQTDSREITAGDVFIAMQGVQQHGLSYLQQVVKAGAVCVVYAEKDAEAFQAELQQCSKDVVQIAVESIEDTAGKIISRFYSSPSKDMNVIAVTGTDGKTSVSRFLAQMLSSDQAAAVIGTTGNGLWGQLKSATHTTPDVLNMHKLLSDMKEQNASVVVMEVSSHGIEQKRISGVDINTAVLTNVSRDHLDYHGTVENYRAIKKQLFALASVKNIVVNVDDQTGLELAKQYQTEKSVWGYSLSEQDSCSFNCVYTRKILVQHDGFVVECVTPKGIAELQIPLLGRFNVSNVLAVLSVLLLNDIALDDAANRISKLQTAPGRMEVFVTDNKPLVIVDFAHTANALQFALQAVREHCHGKVWCVFGCGGDRDQGKRALMGEAAEKNADYVVLTDDNPRNEKSADILQQVLSGITDTNKAQLIPDRRSAIRHAIESAAESDVVLIAGKGHEEYQLVGDLKVPFSDRVVAQEILAGGAG